MRTLLLVALLPFIVIRAEGWQAQGFRIVVVDGEGALNNVETRAARELVIRVEDSTGRPVVGAQVAFDTPDTGAGEVFANGSSHFVATTDVSGRATATGIQNNGTAG